MPDTLASTLDRFRFHFVGEEELQCAVEQVLTDEGFSFSREHSLTEADRIDFLVGGVGLEIKVDGSLSQVTRQLHRYAQCEEVKSLVLLTSRRKHCKMPPEMNGKTLTVIWVSSL